MIQAMRVLGVETGKQWRNMPGRRLVFFGMFLWPVMQLLTTYYTILPAVTPATSPHWSSAANRPSLFAFYATGDLVFTVYFSLVQAAWTFSAERQGGTLQAILLAPTNRLLIVIGNSIGALIRNVWLFLCFLLMFAFIPTAFHVRDPGYVVVVFFAITLPAIAWGAMLNSLMLFARDSTVLFTVLGDPVAFVSGVRVPLFALPAVVAGIGAIFPLTSSLVVLRDLLLSHAGLAAVGVRLCVLALATVLMLGAAHLLLRAGERRAQRTGRFTFF